MMPGTTLIESPRNLGFSGGCNLGITDALSRGADLVLLVNSDAILAPDALGLMEDVLLAESSVGIVGPVLLSRSRPEQVLSTGIAFSGLTGRMRHHGSGHAFDEIAVDRCRPVDAVSGCVMLVRREVFERIGLLDERYFFQFEDVDFCLRARGAGVLSAVAGEAVAYHEGSVSIGPNSPRKLYFAARNHLLLAERAARSPVPGTGLIRSGVILGLNVAFALRSGQVPRGTGLRSIGLGTWHHLRRRYGDGP